MNYLGEKLMDMSSVRSIAADADRIFVSGQFSCAGDVGTPGLAMWEKDKWVSMANESSQGVSGAIKALAVIGTNVYAAGKFTAAGAAAVSGLAC